ncbi:MAG: box helicase-like [Actinomycetia bacterium]|nr:box helicase-like [Actinomycetes bacterium]
MTALTDAMHGDADELLDGFTTWVADRGITLYPAQEEALLELYAGNNVILKTPTGSGKSLVALGAHAAALAQGQRSYYTAPIKALVSEKFFALCRDLGGENVGLLTGDASVNPGAPVICCTAEILANLALRDGAGLNVASVCMDEFHFYADPDRGWAWQVPLLLLPHAQFLLLSATLGDVTFFRDDLTRRTGRTTAVIANAERPIPLVFDYRHTAMHATIEELLETERAPVYVVHFTQAAAVERAQALMSVNLCTREEKDAIAAAIGKFRFGPGFGQSLSRFVRHGVGVHHAGLLPKYRLLVEKLAQEGLLKVICGTDTLGVGINVPIRTVLLTQLCKYDGSRTRLLSAREFHQISGRAGRAGFDTSGTVWAQAPEHVIENERAAAKAADDPKKKRKLVKSKPPERGFVNWTDETFAKLTVAVPEQLTSSFAVSHSTLLNVLDREDDEGPGILKRLLVDNHEPRAAQRRHIRRAISIYRSLERAGVISRTDDERGTHIRVNQDLQRDFRLNQPLSPFVLEAVSRLDRTADTYPLDVLSMVEATLENPEVILRAQLSKLKGEKVAELKAAGMEYEDRMAILETLEHPKPLREFTYDLFDVYRNQHPWVEDHNIRPKSVARDMYERFMTFADYVNHYGLARSEGLVLRYLTDAYKGIVQTVPEDAKTDDVYDLTEWLRETVRQTDSSLLDEWERLRDGGDDVVAVPALPDAPADLTANERAFRLMVRNEVFRQVELLARRAHEDSALLAPYWEVHDSIGIGGDARATALFQLEEGTDVWRVRQVLDDPAGDRDWAARFEVDLAASDEAGAPVVRLVAVSDLP